MGFWEIFGIIATIIGLATTLWAIASFTTKKDVQGDSNTEMLKDLSDKVAELYVINTHELRHNSGSSVKDKAYEAALRSTEAAANSKAALDTAQETLRLVISHMTASSKEHGDMWQAIHEK